jgi:hypothetical protein
MRILDQKVKVKKKNIGLVKVQWNYYDHDDYTWGNKEAMQETHPQFYTNFEEN